MVFTRKPDSRGPEFPTPQAQPTPRTMERPTSQSGYSVAPPTSYSGPSSSGNGPVESVIGNDLTIEGQQITIRCRGSLRVNGNIQADLHSMQLTVGEEAQIHGAIAAESVAVYGRVNGAIHGLHVVLHQSAQVEGDIHSQALTIERGASFDGRSRKITDPSQIHLQLGPTSGASANSGSGTAGHGQNVSVPLPAQRLHS